MSDELNEKELFKGLFMHLIYSFQNLSVMQMGKIVNPATNKIEKDLEQAKHTIDMIRMLKDKTKGNLNSDEQNLLDQTLLNLQLNYADEVNKEGSKKSEGD